MHEICEHACLTRGCECPGYPCDRCLVKEGLLAPGLVNELVAAEATKISKMMFSEALHSFSSGETRTIDALTGGEKGVKVERYDLLPVLPLRSVARVYGYGARKYAERNWEKGYSWSKSYGALQRHANAFWAGETLDPETGIEHLAHVVFHCLAMMEWAVTHPEMDDRVKRS